MLWTSAGLRQRKVWLLPPLLTRLDSLKMVLVKTESRVKGEPKRAGGSRGISASEAPVAVAVSAAAAGEESPPAGSGCAGAGLEVWLVFAAVSLTSMPLLRGDGVADLDIMLWKLARRLEPSEVEMTLLARGRVEKALATRP